MTTKHSLFNRGLSLILALVMVLGNLSGFAMEARAAEGNLFDLIAENETATNEILNTILQNADALPALAAMNIHVPVGEEAPTEVSGYFCEGELNVNPVGNWVPAFYNIGNNKVAFDGHAQIGDADFVSVYYKLDLNAEASVQEVFDYVDGIAASVRADITWLDSIGKGAALQGLGVLEGGEEGMFINEMLTIAKELKFSEVEIDLPTEEEIRADIKLEDVVEVDYNQDVNGDGNIDEADKAQIEAELLADPKVQAKIDAEVQKILAEEERIAEEEFEATKAEYIKVVEELMSHVLVDVDNEYYLGQDYWHPRYKYPIYEFTLRVYAMLKEYDNQGILHYYEHMDEFHAEIRDMSRILNKIVGEVQEDGTYANEEIINAIIAKTDYSADVDAADLEKMAKRMATAANGLPGNSGYISEINLEAANSATALFGGNALIANYATGDLDPVIYAFSDELMLGASEAETYDISFAPVGASITSTKKYQAGYALTEEDVAAHIEAIQAKAALNHTHIADEAALIAEAVGYVVEGAHKFVYELAPNEYAVLVNGVEMKVPARYNSKTAQYYITLADMGFDAEAIHIVTVDGNKMTINDVNTEIAIDVEKMAKGELSVVSENDALVSLVKQLNMMGKGSYKIANGTLVANLTMDQVQHFGMGMFSAEFDVDGDGTPDDFAYIDVLLNGEKFIYDDAGLAFSVPALVNAMLHDEAFTSENLIKMGKAGKGALLHTTMKTPLFEVPLVLNLTATPAQMATVAKALELLSPVMTFEAHDGHLNIDLNIPEHAYEAYLAAALVTGQIDKNNVQALSNMAALNYLYDYFQVIKNDKGVDSETYNNTLDMLGIDKSLKGKYAEGVDLIHTFIQNSEKFDITLGEKTSELKIVAEKTDLNAFLGLIGTSLKELTGGLDTFFDRAPIDTLSYVNIVNEVPDFDAIVIDPTRIVNKHSGNIGINDETSLKEKVMFANVSTNLPAELADVYGSAAVMLLDDINGDLTFNHATILDLNGKTVNGNITAKSTMIIMDSSLNTVSGAKVTGSVSGDVTIMAGIYNQNVSAFLRDGYYQDASGAVKNAMFEISGNKLLVDPKVYINNVDGYLPAVQFLAADIAVDFVLNYYTAAALYANGKNAEGATNKIYDINFEDLLMLLNKKSVGLALDQVLACVNAPELSDFINKILADLANVDKIADCLATGNVISTYKFATHPWQLKLEHVVDGNYLTVGVTANEGLAKTFTIPVALKLDTDIVVEVPNSNREYTIQQILNEMSRIVVTVDDDAAKGTRAEIQINQPVRDGKTLVVGGSGEAVVNLDFSHNEDYNRILGAALAYFCEDLTKDLVKNGCIVELNQVLASVTVGEFFEALNKIVQNKEIPFEKIAEKLDLTLTDEQVAQLNELYDVFQSGVAKVIHKFDLDENDRTPLSALTSDGVIEFHGHLQRTADAYYKNYGVVVNVEDLDATMIIKLAVGDHIPGEVVIEETVNGYPCQHDEVVYCTKCGIELSRKTVGGLWGDVNCDGKVDNLDASWILQYDVELRTADSMHFEVADVSGDGKVDNLDASLILQYDAELRTTFPVEEK